MRELGFKTAVFAGHARRPIGTATRTGSTRSASTARTTTTRSGRSASSSAIAPVFHSSLQGHRVTRSATSYVYNHVGGLAASHESLCKSLFLSGVTHRFPTLRFGFLEGGVAWACSLLGDLVGHWEKRNADAIRSLDPDRLDVDALLALFDRYGDDRVHAGLDRAARVLLPTERAARAARRVRGGRARVGRRPVRPLRPQLLLRVRGRRSSRHVGVRRTRERGRRPSPADLRLRHLALGRARHDRAGRGGLRARGGRPDRRRRVPRADVPEPGAPARGHESRLLRRHGVRNRRRETRGTE